MNMAAACRVENDAVATASNRHAGSWVTDVAAVDDRLGLHVRRCADQTKNVLRCLWSRHEPDTRLAFDADRGGHSQDARFVGCGLQAISAMRDEQGAAALGGTDGRLKRRAIVAVAVAARAETRSIESEVWPAHGRLRASRNRGGPQNRCGK
jgi:hypothetical protein